MKGKLFMKMNFWLFTFKKKYMKMLVSIID